jgi:hypothetical protein
MTARSQVEKLRRAADRAVRIAPENRRLDYALEDIEIDLRYAVERRVGSCAHSILPDFRWKKSSPHCSPDCWTNPNADTSGSSSETILAESA